MLKKNSVFKCILIEIFIFIPLNTLMTSLDEKNTNGRLNVAISKH
jgi:hypothetical protein